MKNMAQEKVRVPDLARMKAARQPITMLTAYDFPFARIFDNCGVDVILVGDSLAMAVRGEDNTLAVTVDEVIYHTRMVARARRRALVVADMPFLSYQVNAEDAIRNAGRLIKEGRAEAVKLEGGVAIADTVAKIAAVDIPVMGHVGLTPQSIHRMGGHRVQGRKSGRAPARAAEHPRVVNDFVDGDGECAVLAAHRHRKAFTDEQQVDTGGIEDACEGEIARGQHRDWLPRGLHPRQIGNANFS
jgi:ketopantoate hydroxymethyltransferase